MANPQLENGYTRIANEILEILSQNDSPISTKESILMFVIRYTYGYSKKSNKLSVKFISDNTKIPYRTTAKCINELINKKLLIEVSPPDFSSSREIMFNKNYEEWVSKNDTVLHLAECPKKTDRVSKNDTDRVSKKDTLHIKEIYKEKYKKNNTRTREGVYGGGYSGVKNLAED